MNDKLKGIGERDRVKASEKKEEGIPENPEIRRRTLEENFKDLKRIAVKDIIPKL